MSLRCYASVAGRYFVSVAFIIFCLNASGQPQTSQRQFPPGSINQLDDLPAGLLRSRLETLPPTARSRALDWLGSFHFTEGDLASLRADDAGGIYYVCEFRPAESSTQNSSPEPSVTSGAAVPVSPFPGGLVFHSRPGSQNVLYLDFAGEDVTGTAWNSSLNRTTIPAVAFSTDSDYSTFSDSEQTAIKRVWLRMAEDYAAFDIDVTTERPASFNSRTAHALITRNTDANGAGNPSSSAGGVAYINVFGSGSYSTYRPAWIYYNNLANNESYIAEAASHEIGHNLGLSHDGKTDGSEYYGGHGSGEISWGPIMGTGYYRNVSQWSKGEYYLGNNTEDDLVVIAGKVGYRGDDHGDTRTAATPLTITDGTNVVATTPETDPENLNPSNKGVLEGNSDVDVFSFITGTGSVHFDLNPWVMPSGTRGGNVDLVLELYDEGGSLLASANPPTQTGASIDANLTEGRYYLQVYATGAGDPFSSSPSGYTVYGCVGQYFINGYITESSGLVFPPVAGLQVSDLDLPDQSNQVFTVTYSDAVGVDISTIDSNDIRVTGPNGYDRPAQLISIDRVSNGSPCVATYAVQPLSGGAWAPVDNGTYTIWMETNQVANTQGAWVAAGELGQFSVAIPVVIYSEDLTANPNWTFQGQWEYGAPNYDFTGPAGGYTGVNIIGYNLSGDYTKSMNPAYAVTAPIDCTGNTTLTLRFRQWLRLGSGGAVTLEAASDGSGWVTVWSGSGSVSDSSWQLAQFSLPGAVLGGSTIQLRWGISSDNRGQTDIGWNIDDIEILGNGGAVDTTPPEAALNVVDITSAGSSSHSCSVVYTDNVGLRLSSLGSGDLLVTGPSGYSNLVGLVGADLSSNGTPCTATYSIPSPQATWQSADNGTYSVMLLADEVEDVFSNAAPQTLLGSFMVSIPAEIPGQLDVYPAGGLNYSGVEGGPFQPPSIICVLTNTGGLAFDWTAAGSEPWLGVSPFDGTLGVGEAVSVAVTLNTNASSLPAGTYSNGVSFVNVTTGIGSTDRGVLLSVTPLTTFQLTAMPNVPGWGTVDPTNGTYPSGSIVELTAVPASYYGFHQWAGAVSATNNPVSVMINSNLVVTAMFGELLTTNHSTPLWWLAEQGYTNDFETAVTNLGANGMKLWESYVAGLDPADPGSRLRLNINFTNPAILTWQTVSNRIYTVHWSTNGGAIFYPVAGAIDLDSTITAFTNAPPASVPDAFYRLEVQKP